VPVPDLKTIFANDLGTRPESRGPALDETSHLRILNPPVRGLRVMLSTDYADVLATLSDESEVAVIWTTRLEDLVWHAETRGGEWWFRTVRPRPGFDATSDAITRLASVSEGTPVAIALLPELSLDVAGVEAVLAWSQDRGHPFGLLIPGSVHTAIEEGRQANVATLQFGNGDRSTHRKFNPFILDLPVEGRREAHTEDISTGDPTLTLHLLGDWSFMVLICKDLLEDGVAPLLQELRARLVLVPARSPRTTDFEAVAAAHAAAVQGMVLIANEADPDPERPGPASAIVARPLRVNVLEVIGADVVRAPSHRRFRIRNQ
jgi:hypothetical protein